MSASSILRSNFPPSKNKFQNSGLSKYMDFDYESMVRSFCGKFTIKLKFKVANKEKIEKKFEDICERVLEENRLAEETKQKEIKEELRKKIYRTRLASKVKSSIVTDFLTMRFR